MRANTAGNAAKRRPARRAVAIAAAVLAIAVVLLAVHNVTLDRLSAQTKAADRRTLDVYAAGITATLDRYPRSIALLTQDPRLHQAFQSGVGATDMATRILREYVALSGAESAFLLDRGGALVAASADRATLLETANWFVTRDAYQAALTGRLGRSFGLSPPDSERRYFYARRVSGADGPLGVLVVALAIDELELLWRLAKRQVLVVDRDGVVVLAAQPAWQFLNTDPDSGAAPGGGLPFALPPIDGCDVVFQIDGAGQLCQARRIHHLEWDVYLLSPTGPLIRQAWFVTFAVALALLSAGLLGGFAWLRLTLKDRTNRALQSRVSARTAQLQAANTHLREEIQSRIAKENELQQAQDELVQAGKMAALGQMAAGLVHELNQPLAAMRTYNDNTAAFLQRDQSQAASRNIGLMQELIERMASITAQLKNFIRRTPLRLEPVELGPAIAGAIKLIEDTTPESPTRIVVGPLPAQTIARAEPVRLQQVLVNLIRNGVDAIGAQPGQVTITVRDDDDRLVVIVADDGPGIPPQEVGRVFDPFFTTKGPGRGMGLGLSVSQRITKDFGGGMQAQSELGRGSRFTFTLRHWRGETV